MGTRANSTYMPYVITTDETIHRQILCDTMTEGGGWIVIQVCLVSNDNKIKTVFNRPVLYHTFVKVILMVGFGAVSTIRLKLYVIQPSDGQVFFTGLISTRRR